MYTGIRPLLNENRNKNASNIPSPNNPKIVPTQPEIM